jgi:hypothetical protein
MDYLIIIVRTILTSFEIISHFDCFVIHFSMYLDIILYWDT